MPKVTTNLALLHVIRDPHKALRHTYDRILYALTKFPEDSHYRQSTEKIIKHRLAIVETESDVGKLETKINDGQAEELVIKAQNELILARRLAYWKPWETPAIQPPKDQWKWPI